MPAPELLRAAIDAGVTVGWEPDGAVWAQVADRRNRRQVAAFERLTANVYAPAVLQGYYYAGDFGRKQ